MNGTMKKSKVTCYIKATIYFKANTKSKCKEHLKLRYLVRVAHAASYTWHTFGPFSMGKGRKQYLLLKKLSHIMGT